MWEIKNLAGMSFILSSGFLFGRLFETVDVMSKIGNFCADVKNKILNRTWVIISFFLINIFYVSSINFYKLNLVCELKIYL